MKRLLIILCLAVLLPGTLSHGEEPAGIYVDEGMNRIALSVINSRNVGISDVTVTLDTDILPNWLTVNICADAIDVPADAKGSEKLFLELNVTDAPAGAKRNGIQTLTKGGPI